VYPGVSLPNYTAAAGFADCAENAKTFGPAGATIGMVGRISATKGQDVFIRAASRVNERHPESRFKIIGAALFNDSAFEVGLMLN